MMKTDCHIESILHSSLLRLAEAGIAEAQYRQGKQYQTGDGVAHDMALAFAWFLKSANNDHPKAQLEVGLCLEKGVGVASDLIRAAIYYEKASGHGITEASWRLGDMFLEGRGVHLDYSKARELYETACKSKEQHAENDYDGDNICPEAEWSLGVMKEDGIGCDKDIEGAKIHYARASGLEKVKERNLVELELRYARLIDKGPKDFNSYRRAAEVGSLEAMREYVERSYSHNTWHSRDDEDYDPFSQSLFEHCLDELIDNKDSWAILLACKKTILPGYNELQYKLDGKDCLHFLHSFILSGDQVACQLLARAYVNGVIVDKSVINEIRCYRLARKCQRHPSRALLSNSQFKKLLSGILARVSKDEGDGYYDMWKLLTNPEYVVTPREFALPWLMKAVERGNKDAVLDKLNEDRRIARARFEPRILGLEKSNPRSDYAIYSRENEPDSRCSWDSILRDILKSAELGDHDAELWAARILADGRLGDHTSGNPKPVKKDVASAVMWYEKVSHAIELSPEDKCRYANCLVESRNRDWTLITRLYAEAAGAGLHEAEFKYASRLIKGEGCNADATRAMNILHSINSVEAQDALAHLYISQQDISHALECYERILDCSESVIEADKRLDAERHDLASHYRKQWEQIRAMELAQSAERRRIVMKTAVDVLKLYREGIAVLAQMQKAWACLQHETVEFPIADKDSDKDFEFDNLPF